MIGVPHNCWVRAPQKARRLQSEREPKKKARKRPDRAKQKRKEPSDQS
jgi:hypothetical protein